MSDATSHRAATCPRCESFAVWSYHGRAQCDSCTHSGDTGDVHGFEVEVHPNRVILGVPNGEDYTLTGSEAEAVAYLILRAAERSAK